VRKCLAAGPCSPKEAERAWRYAILSIQTKQRNPSAGQRGLLFYSTVPCVPLIPGPDGAAEETKQTCEKPGWKNPKKKSGNSWDVCAGRWLLEIGPAFVCGKSPRGLGVFIVIVHP
jgi:hypothetical protein